MPESLVVRDTTYDNYPPYWAQWSTFVDAGKRPLDLGFSCALADLNRFAHRYRLAKSFRGIELHQYSQATTYGYGCIFWVFLVWSAFEHFLRIIPCSQDGCTEILRRYPARKAIAYIRAQDPEYRFFGMIASKAHPRGRKELQAFMREEPINYTYLASTIRHIFAHGELTPNVNRSNPTAVGAICEAIAQVHLRVLEREFSRRLHEVGYSGS
jgi:hypothetical protein